ncbi:MAG: non-canonical purine NTP pyrophosphatase, partial [Bacteroidetes bacterium]|nr:non-canonical purine NTP pyrophosphatase [Bacteroidota bacterium]
MELIFATQNKNKLKEVQFLLGETFSLKTPEDYKLYEDIEETGATLVENAIIKASYIYERTKMSCFADDTGLEVQFLDGRPGVYSARFAGEEKNSEKNIDLLLELLEETDERGACFKTIICLILDGVEHIFEGVVNGVITSERTGSQ